MPGVDDARSHLTKWRSSLPAFALMLNSAFSVERMVHDYLSLYREMYDEVALSEDSN